MVTCLTDVCKTDGVRAKVRLRRRLSPPQQFWQSHCVLQQYNNDITDTLAHFFPCSLYGVYYLELPTLHKSN